MKSGHDLGGAQARDMIIELGLLLAQLPDPLLSIDGKMETLKDTEDMYPTEIIAIHLNEIIIYRKSRLAEMAATMTLPLTAEITLSDEQHDDKSPKLLEMFLTEAPNEADIPGVLH